MQIHVHHLYTTPRPGGLVGYCGTGCRAWFAAHGLSWSDFVEHGLPEEVLAATGDVLVLSAIAHAHAQQAEQAEQEDHG